MQPFEFCDMQYYLEKYSRNNNSYEILYKFFNVTEKRFKPPIRQRRPLKEYINKLIDEAVILLAKNAEDNKIIGLAAYYCTPKDFQYAFLSYIATDTKLKGVGNCLVKTMIKDCKKKKMDGIETQTWESNKRSIGLFQKHGFKIKYYVLNRNLDERSVILKLEF